MSKVFILYRSFFDAIGEKFTVGGIQTYIRQLIGVIQKSNYTPVVVQFADCNFYKKYNIIDVYGVDVLSIHGLKNKVKRALSFIKKSFNNGDILIFATDDIYIQPFTEQVIVIQHGITWDVPQPNHYSRMHLLIEVLRKARHSYARLRRIKNIKNMICVDYNYVNWHRTQVSAVDQNIYVIPNCTEIKKNYIKKNGNTIKIIFARRFEIYRGTRLFSDAIKKILDKYDNVHVTFAGSGSDEGYLKKLFLDNANVDFITYESEKSHDIHEKYHIAVIPTIGSEGTSLSLLEAMASKCAVIATNVGGMTNIILDNYNGLLINPDQNQLYDAIEKLIVDKELREKLSENAFNTVAQAFNRDLWEKRWFRVLENFSSDSFRI